MAKLREPFGAHLQDPDGVLYCTYKIGASVAAMEGDRDRALNLIDKQVERSLEGSWEIRLAPWFKEFHGDPRFEAAVAKLDTHVASEKTKAETMGLLPLTPETEALWRGLAPPPALSLTGAISGSEKDDAS